MATRILTQYQRDVWNKIVHYIQTGEGSFVRDQQDDTLAAVYGSRVAPVTALRALEREGLIELPYANNSSFRVIVPVALAAHDAAKTANEPSVSAWTPKAGDRVRVKNAPGRKTMQECEISIRVGMAGRVISGAMWRADLGENLYRVVFDGGESYTFYADELEPADDATADTARALDEKLHDLVHEWEAMPANSEPRDAEIARLTKERNDAWLALEDALRDLAAAKTEAEALREALRPFAEIGEILTRRNIHPAYNNEDRAIYTLNASELMRRDFVRAYELVSDPADALTALVATRAATDTGTRLTLEDVETALESMWSGDDE